jgi:hypothetical protein
MTNLAIFGPKSDEVTGGWRKLRNEELHHFHSSPSIITIIKSRRIRWADHVARMGEKRNDIFFLESLKGRNHVEDLGVDGRIVKNWILGKLVLRVWVGLIWLRMGTGDGIL